MMDWFAIRKRRRMKEMMALISLSEAKLWIRDGVAGITNGGGRSESKAAEAV